MYHLCQPCVSQIRPGLCHRGQFLSISKPQQEDYEVSRTAFSPAAIASLALVMSSGVLWSPGPLSCSYNACMVSA